MGHNEKMKSKCMKLKFIKDPRVIWGATGLGGAMGNLEAAQLVSVVQEREGLWDSIFIKFHGCFLIGFPLRPTDCIG